MGPQLHRCGKSLKDTPLASVFRVLQWGRNFIVAESDYDVTGPLDLDELQWGRNFIVAESRCGTAGT